MVMKVKNRTTLEGLPQGSMIKIMETFVTAPANYMMHITLLTEEVEISWNELKKKYN